MTRGLLVESVARYWMYRLSGLGTTPPETAGKPKLVDLCLKHYEAMWPVGKWLLDEVWQG